MNDIVIDIVRGIAMAHVIIVNIDTRSAILLIITIRVVIIILIRQHHPRQRPHCCRLRPRPQPLRARPTLPGAGPPARATSECRIRGAPRMLPRNENQTASLGCKWRKGQRPGAMFAEELAVKLRSNDNPTEPTTKECAKLFELLLQTPLKEHV